MPPFRSIWFDCDSTLATIEGVDALAQGGDPAVQQKITELTEAAMDGRVPIDDVYAERLELVRPTRAAVEAIGQAYVENLVPDAADTVAALHALGKHVGIVSGGLLPAVRQLAAALGVDDERVFAVGVVFDDSGAYEDFHRASPLARSGGKRELLGIIGDEERPVAFVGDGVTDLEAAPAVERFIGFGGVAKRDRVVEGAEFFAEGPSLATVLPHCLTDDERATLRADDRFARLVS